MKQGPNFLTILEEKDAEYASLIKAMIKKENQDTLTQRLLLIEQTRFEQEDQNLFYVALTRARQQLYVSGCRPNKNPEKLGWYGQLETRFTEKTVYPKPAALNQAIPVQPA